MKEELSFVCYRGEIMTEKNSSWVFSGYSSLFSTPCHVTATDYKPHNQQPAKDLVQKPKRIMLQVDLHIKIGF